jgi:hypothetical protein
MDVASAKPNPAGKKFLDTAILENSSKIDISILKIFLDN